MTTKKSVSYRLTEATLRELESLAKRHHISQAELIAVLVHALYEGWGKINSKNGWGLPRYCNRRALRWQ